MRSPRHGSLIIRCARERRRERTKAEKVSRSPSKPHRARTARHRIAAQAGRTVVGAGSAARQLRATAVSPARHYLPIPAPALLAKASPAGSLGDFQNHAEFRRGAQIAGVPIESRDLPEEGARGRGPGYSPRGAHEARPNSLRVIGGRSRNLLMRACSSIGGRAEVVCGSIRPARSG